MKSKQKFGERLLSWYEKNKRDLPWRRTRDPYKIWLSEIMLQQTRVAAVIPYYEKFLERFPSFRELAAAPEEEVLRLWAGLGYYSRARNLQRAAQEMERLGAFPSEYEGIRALPGVGDYTAAAVGSIAFGIPVGVLDGNVLRVMARVMCEEGDIGAGTTRERLRKEVNLRLTEEAPGAFNQGLMELGATICLPQNPKCLICPINDICCSRGRGTQNSLPIKIRKAQSVEEEKRLLWIERAGKILLWQRPENSKRLAGFWELPEMEDLPGVELGKELGQFRHAIVNHKYEVFVHTAKLKARVPNLYKWFFWGDLGELPLSTITKKSLKMVQARSAPVDSSKG